MLLIAVCLGPAGIFIPSLAVGGAWGRLVGMLVQACIRHAGSSLPVSLPAYTVQPSPNNSWHALAVCILPP